MCRVRLAGMKKHTSVNGPGVRCAVFFQGCPHHCPHCQNPETWKMDGGEEYDLYELIDSILAIRYLDGITLSGGDPLMQPEAAEKIAKAARENGLDVWCYTGWTWEEIADGKAGPGAVKALEQIDVLVDGPFVNDLRSDEVLFRGSSNQRLIDVKKSLKEKKVILFEQ